MLQNSKVLVTGGAGFIGSHLIDAIIDKCAEVRVLDNLSEAGTENIKHLENKENFHLIKGDILDSDALDESMKDIDVVFHLAAFMERSSNAVDLPLADLKANAEGTLKVLMAAQKAGVKKFIYASTAGVYGQAQFLPQSEEHPINPNWPYGISKLAGEKYVRAFHELHEIETVSIRIAMCYGEREWYGRVMTIFFKNVLENKPITIFGDGKQIRDYVHVDDVVDIFVKAAEKDGLGGEVFNGGTGRGVTITQLADMILEVTGKKGQIEKKYLDQKQGTGGRFLAELKELNLDPKKAQEKLGYEVKVPLEKGLRRQLEWVKENFDKWNKKNV